MKMNKKKSVLVVALTLMIVVAMGIVINSGLVSKASDTQNNETVIYYAGFTNPYIHYKIGNGEWTQAPGVQMTKTDELTGIFYKIVLNLGSATEVTACFNNGNGSWDNNNTKDYKFGVGSYTCYAGNVSKIEVSGDFEVSSFRTNPEESYYINDQANGVYLEATALGGTAPYQYQFGYVKDEEEFIISDYSSKSNCGWKADKTGTYTLFVNVKDANNNVATKTIEDYEVKSLKINGIYSDLQAPQYVGQTIKLYMKASGEKSYRDSLVQFTIEKDGEKEELVGTYETALDAKIVEWTPKSAGTYNITVKVRDDNMNTDTMSTTYEVKGVEDEYVTVYYGDTDYKYIHYSVNGGDWTSLPGVLMNKCDDVDGYKYMISIYVGKGGKLEAAFNDGSGNWDSLYGKNYQVSNPGVYYISDYTIKTQP